MNWNKTDRILLKAQKEIKTLYESIGDDLITAYSLCDFDELNNLSPKLKKRYDRSLNEWKDINSDLFNIYLNKKVKNNRDIVEMFIYASYFKKLRPLYEKSMEVFLEVSEDISLQGEKETPFKYHITKDDVLEFSSVLGLSFIDYLDQVSLLDAQEAVFLLIRQLEQRSGLDVEHLLEKHRKRIINIHDNKHSGVLHDTSIKIGNDTYISPMLNENHHIKFIAVLDEKTTKMCRSLNGQIFNTVDMNEFDRYSENNGTIIHHKVKGLVSGLNYPPIIDNVHHCRSYTVFID